MDLSLEELMDIEVYSVGKKEQRLADAAAAITVISQEDIRRSGFTSVPEVLRLVPGVQVARLDDWQAASGGFRVDRQTDEGTSLSLQGSLYDGEAGQTYSVITSPVPPFGEVFDSVSPFRGGHLLGRWQRLFSSQSDMALQVYYDGHDLDDRIASDTRHTLDVEFQAPAGIGDAPGACLGGGIPFVARRVGGQFHALVRSDPPHR